MSACVRSHQSVLACASVGLKFCKSVHTCRILRPSFFSVPKAERRNVYLSEVKKKNTKLLERQISPHFSSVHLFHSSYSSPHLIWNLSDENLPVSVLGSYKQFSTHKNVHWWGCWDIYRNFIMRLRSSIHDSRVAAREIGWTAGWSGTYNPSVGGASVSMGYVLTACDSKLNSSEKRSKRSFSDSSLFGEWRKRGITLTN